jgi:hypothetical protein
VAALGARATSNGTIFVAFDLTTFALKAAIAGLQMLSANLGLCRCHGNPGSSLESYTEVSRRLSRQVFETNKSNCRFWKIIPIRVYLARDHSMMFQCSGVKYWVAAASHCERRRFRSTGYVNQSASGPKTSYYSACGVQLPRYHLLLPANSSVECIQ